MNSIVAIKLNVERYMDSCNVTKCKIKRKKGEKKKLRECFPSKGSNLSRQRDGPTR